MHRITLLACTLSLAALLTGAAEAGTAESALKASGVRAGLCVHLGATDGSFTAELQGGGKLLVHGLAADAASVAKVRKFVQSKGVYGRVSVERSPLKKLPYAENLVNLIVAEDLAALLGRGLDLKEVARVLAPNGVLCFGGKVDAARLKAAGFEGVKGTGAWTVARKPRPKAMDGWTHFRHGPDGNKVSEDTLVGPPARLRWIVGQTWSRRHCWTSMKAMVSAGGRVFYVYDLAPTNVVGPARDFLMARDAYNGLLLWKRPVESTYRSGKLKGKGWSFPRRALVAAGDRVYAVLEPDGPLTALDAATGETVRVYKGSASPSEVVCSGKYLVLAGRRSVSVLDAASGAQRWMFPGSGMDAVAADGKVFFQSGWGSFICKDLATGRDVWKQDTRSWAKGRSHLLFHRDGRLFLGASLGYGKPSLVHALSAKDGSKLWSYPGYGALRGSIDVSFAKGLVWINTHRKSKTDTGAALGLDPETGKVKKRIPYPRYFYERGHARCYPNNATVRYLLHGSRGTDFIDVESGQVHDMRAFCGDCGFGIVPANGLVYMAPNACTCWNYLGGVRALAAAGGAKVDRSGAPLLEKGPAFGAGGGGKASADDWPTHRHDEWRSGITASAVPPNLKPVWSAAIGGRLSAPTIAGGTVYVAAVDAHQVVALDAGTGKPRWRFTAGGRVDSPPTIYRGLALFGSRDGWVYCLRAAGGELAWRLRAAPAERRMMAFDQLESAWPVHGSVLIMDGVAFFAAGRAPELDGGVIACAVDPASGKVVWKQRAPMVAGVMVRGPRGIYMGTREFNPKTGANRSKSTHRYVNARSGLLDGSYAGRRRWGNGIAGAEFMVASPKKTCGFVGFKRPGKNALSTPGKGEYRLFMVEHPGGRNNKPKWSVGVSLRVRAMVMAGEVVFAAGPPDVAGEKEYWAAFDGKKGAEIRAFSAADGKKLGALKLDALPVFDGMAVAGGRLYLSCKDGRLRCFGKK